MSLSESQVQEALRKLVDPNTGKDFVSSRSVRNVKIAADSVALEIELGYPGKSQFEPIRRQVIDALKAAGAPAARVAVRSAVVAHAVQRGVKLIPGSTSSDARDSWSSRCTGPMNQRSSPVFRSRMRR